MEDRRRGGCGGVGEVISDLHHAADVSGRDEIAAGFANDRGFFSSELGGDHGLIEIVGSCRTAAALAICEIDELDAFDGLKDAPRLGPDLLRVAVMAGVVVGDPYGAFEGRGRFNSETVEKDADIGNEWRESFGPFLFRRTLKHQGVFAHSRAATGGIDNDGIDVVRECRDRFACGGTGRGCFANVPGERAATGLIFGNKNLDAVVREHIDRCAVDLRGENLLNAAGEQRDTRPPGAAGRDAPGKNFRGRKGGGEQIEHGTERLWQQRFEDPGGAAEPHGETEAARMGEGLHDDEAFQGLDRRAFGRRARRGAVGTDEFVVGDARRTGGFAGEAPEAAVDVRLGVGRAQRAFEDLLHQVDSSAWGIHFFAELLVGGT